MKKHSKLIAWIFGTRREWRDNRFPLLWSVLAGVIGIFAYPAFSVYILIWFFLAPFLYALARATTWRMVAWCTFAFAFPWYYGMLWWLNTLTFFNSLIPIGIICMPIIGMVWMLLFSLPAAWVMRNAPIWASPFLTAFIWAGFEQTHMIGDLAFPWNFLGHALAVTPMLSLAQWAAYGGVGLLSVLIMFTNASLANMVYTLRHPDSVTRNKAIFADHPPFRQALFAMLSTFIILICLMLLGSSRIFSIREKSTERLLRVAVIQPNVPQVERAAYYQDPSREREDHILASTWQQLNALASQGIDLCVMPETAAPYPFFVYQEGLRQRFSDMSTKLNADFILGADNREPLDTYAKRFSKGQYFGKAALERAAETSRTLPVCRLEGENLIEPSEQMASFVSAWQVKPGKGFSPEVYDKMQLVPFGECAPILGLIPGFEKYIMMAGSFQKGTHQVIFDTKGVKYGTMICFESCFPHLARGLAQAGAQMLLVITNDSWYDPAYLGDAFTGNGFLRRIAEAGPEQHMRQSIMRAIETGLPVVRAAQTGISAVIAPTGHIIDSIPINKTGTIITNINRMSGKDRAETFYTRFGDWPGIIGLIIILCIFCFILVKNRKSTGSQTRCFLQYFIFRKTTNDKTS